MLGASHLERSVLQLTSATLSGTLASAKSAATVTLTARTSFGPSAGAKSAASTTVTAKTPLAPHAASAAQSTAAVHAAARLAAAAAAKSSATGAASATTGLAPHAGSRSDAIATVGLNAATGAKFIRERPPLRLDIDIATPDGHHTRWASDEPNPANVPGALTFSTTIPGGFEQCSCTLAREPRRDYPDLEELSTVTVYGAGGGVAWQGRLESSPRTSGEQEQVSPQSAGWQAHLNDDQSAREIYLDIDQSAWQAASLQRKLNLLAIAGPTGPISTEDANATPDQSTGQPSLSTQLTGPWSNEHVAEGWYDARGLDIGALYYAWKLGAGSTIDPADTHWSWQAFLSSDDIASALDATGNLRGAGPGSGALNASAIGRKWALVQLAYDITGGANGQAYPLPWTFLGVVGNHGVPIQGVLGATGGIGVLASDVVAHALSRWAPRLKFSTGAGGTIQPTGFPIPQLAITTPGGASAIVNAATAFELPDWAVWEGPTFWMAARNQLGGRRSWRARVAPSALQETGPQVDQLYNGVIVAFTDVTGLARSAGPTGSGCDVESALLLDPDPSSPGNQAGIRLWSPPLQMGTSTADAAIQVGRVFLQAQKELSTAGQAVLTGHVMDSSGVLWPAWAVRAGDEIVFTDAADPSARRIVSTSYSDQAKANTIQLDSPPQGMQALLARLSVVLSGTGFS